MAVIGINYSEGNKKNIGYKSVRLSYGLNLRKEKIFKTGNFVKDWYDMRKLMITKLSNKHEYFSQSSSVNHFIMDGAPYDSAYLHIVDEKPVLKYINRLDKNYLFSQQDVYQKGIEFFVAKGTKPTWEELKVICGDKSKKKRKSKK